MKPELTTFNRNGTYYVVPQRQPRAWWNMDEAGRLFCSLCGAAASTADLRICSCCGSNMAIDEEWTKRILKRGFRRDAAE